MKKYRVKIWAAVLQTYEIEAYDSRQAEQYTKEGDGKLVDSTVDGWMEGDPVDSVEEIKPAKKARKKQ